MRYFFEFEGRYLLPEIKSVKDRKFVALLKSFSCHKLSALSAGSIQQKVIVFTELSGFSYYDYLS